MSATTDNRTQEQLQLEPERYELTAPAPYRFDLDRREFFKFLDRFKAAKDAGFKGVVLTAALFGIPGEIVDAARIGGAGAWDLLWRIKLPLIQPVMMFLVVIGTIGAFQIFDTVYVMTQGGPQYATQTIVGLIYAFAFQVRQSEGMAAALGVILFLIIMPISLIQWRVLRRDVQY